MIKPVKILLLTIIACKSVLMCDAQHNSDSLAKYLGIAAEKNPGVLQKYLEYKAALQKVPQAASLPDPQLSLGVFVKPMELPGGNQVADVKLMQMFPWFGVLRNAKDEMSLMANARFELFLDAQLQLSFDVRQKWSELFRIRKEISITEKNVEILKTIERLAMAAFKSPSAKRPATSLSANRNDVAVSQTVNQNNVSGMQSMSSEKQGKINSAMISQAAMQTGPMSSQGNQNLTDLYKIQMEAAENENNITVLRNNERTVIAAFNGYLNRDPEMKVSTPDFMISDSLGLPLSLVYDSIMANNPMLKMIRYEKQSLEARSKMTKGMSYPMVGVGVDYAVISRNEMSASTMNGKDMIMPMVTITLPVYRKKYSAMQSEAELLGESSLKNYEETRRVLQTEFYKASEQYDNARQRAGLYNNQLSLATKSYEIMLKSFSSSSAGLTELLRFRQQILDYELKKIEALSDFNTAVAWFERLMALSPVN